MRQTVLGLFFVVLAVLIVVWLLIKKGSQIPTRVMEKKTQEEKAQQVALGPVRQPAVAGAFYPQEKNTLEEAVDSFLKEIQPAAPQKGLLRILIVPHAGYQYSGKVAAWGFVQLKNLPIKKVILLGVSHRLPFSGAAVYPRGSWQTPLGRVAVDGELASKIMAESGLVFAQPEYHNQEHSLEVELPFLQKVLPEFEVVPILMGSESRELIEELALALAKNIDQQTVVVVSSDLSHYPPYEEAKKVDKKTIEAILSGEVRQLEQASAQSMAGGIANLSTTACGEAAIKVGMRLAKKMGKGKWRLLNYANSGDTAGKEGQVVGYAAIGFWLTSESRGVESLNKHQQEKLLEIARKTLENYLTKKEIPRFEIKSEKLKQKTGAFVTLKKNKQLRGCIGQIEPSEEPLWKVVQKMALRAALEDPRFPPLKPEELGEIKIEISVLSKPEKIADPYKIKLGKHGVIVKKGLRSGVFLPQVATENNWDLETFMGQLCTQKAGLSWDCWKKGEVDIYVFTAQVFEEE